MLFFLQIDFGRKKRNLTRKRGQRPCEADALQALFLRVHLLLIAQHVLFATGM